MKVVVLAGQGFLPVEAVKNLKSRGYQVTVYSFTENTVRDMEGLADEICTFSLGQVGKILKSLKKSRPDALVFAGKFSRQLLESNLMLDFKAIWMLARLRDRQEDTIMLAIVEEIEKLGIQILSQREVLHHLMPGAGIYSQKKPSAGQLADVSFGYEKGLGIAGLDIGQSIVVKNRTVLAVEAIEGTDEMIKRTAGLSSGQFTFVKVAKPQQDYRFDVPVMGMDTMNNLYNSKCAVAAFEADNTLFIDLKECIDFADRHGMVLMGYSPKSDI